MCALHLRQMNLLSNFSRFFGTKQQSLSVIRGQALSSTYPITTLARVISCSSSYSSASAWQQCLHPWSFKQNKSAWLHKSASYSTAVTNSEPSEESDLTPKPSNRHKKTTEAKLLRPERLESRSVFREKIAEKGEATWTDDDWANLAESLPLTGKGLWEVTCMHTLYQDNNVSVAKSLMKYLEKQATTPSQIVLTFYIGLLGKTSSGSEDQENEMYKYYQHLLSQTDLLDAASIEVLIAGLSMTRYYHECLKLMKMSQETSSLSSGSLVKLLQAGLRNKDTDICQFVLTELEENTEPTYFNPFTPQVVEECLAVNNQLGLEMVMNFLQRHKLFLQRKTLEEIATIFNRYHPNQWIENYGFINHKSGRCSVCGHQMKRLEVSDDDFRSIQSAFLDQVIIGKNVFFKTTPDEVDSFIKFVQKMGPFDVVIDGLNIVHRFSHVPSQEQLEKAVELFTSQGKRILILGSKALMKYVSNIKKMVPKPAIYMTSTTKADDAFFIYAALHSGKNTLVVSGDKLRDHKFLLSPSLRPIFHEWVLSAQVYHWYISKSEQFTIGKRHIYSIGPAKDEGGWHIPENDLSLTNPFGRLSVLCLRDRASLQVPHYTGTNHSKLHSEGPKQTLSMRPDLGQTTPCKEQKQKNLFRPIKDNASTTLMPRKADRKLSQLNKNKFESEKEWFDN